MSANRHVEILCDDCGEAEWGTSAAKVRKALRAVGWLVNTRAATPTFGSKDRPGDLCDRCKSKKDSRT